MNDLRLINMQDIQVEKMRIVVYPLPYGKVTITQGDPGEGKTTLILQIIARLAAGEKIEVQCRSRYRR